MKYFSLLTVIFLTVSSPEILCLLSFHNEIHSFSFVVTKNIIYSMQNGVLHSSSLLQRPLCYGTGTGVVMTLATLCPRMWLCKAP